MEDMVIKGSGNSRFLRSVANILTLYPTYEDFAQALRDGTFPIDLNGINPAGWEVLGDKLGKATLLTDALCTALGLATTATPTQAMDKLRQLTATAQSAANSANSNANGRTKIITGSYVGTDSNSKSVYVGAQPKVFIVMPTRGMMFYSGSSSWGNCGMIAIKGTTMFLALSMYGVNLTWGNTMSWTYDVSYNNISSWGPALNYSSVTYQWLALV